MIDFVGVTSDETSTAYYEAYGISDTGSPVAASVQNVLITFGAVRTVRREAAETLKERFARLVREWVADTQYTSSMDDIVNSRPHQEILSLGRPAVSLILDDLERSPKP